MTSNPYHQPTISITVTCKMCGKEVYILKVDSVGYVQWKHKEKNIQDALPDLTPDQRELLITGFCGICFDALFPEEEE